MTRVFHIVSNKEWGGGEQFVYDLARRQLADGMEVGVFCRKVGSIVDKFKELGVRVYSLRLGGAADIGSAWRMSRIVKEGGECVIHAHNFKDAFTACYARKMVGGKRIKVVMNRHLTRTGKNTLLYKWLYGQVEAICFDSELSRDVFLSTKPTISPEKLSVVHTSIVAPSEVEDIAVRKEFGVADGTVLAMYHGRLDPEKGLDVLLEASARLKELDFRLILIGRGSAEYTAHLEGKIAELGLGGKVSLAGFRHPVLPYVAKADFGVLASTVREGCPLSPQEYMSQGHPVVATDNGGQKEYMRDGENGLLVPPGDVEALASAMRRLIEDGEMRKRLGEQARVDFNQNLSYESFYRKIKALYD